MKGTGEIKKKPKKTTEKGGERALGHPQLKEEIEEEKREKEDSEFRRTLTKILEDQDSIKKIREEKASLRDVLKKKLEEEKTENPSKKADRIQARLKEDLKRWTEDHAEEIGLNLKELRKAIKEYKSKTNGKVYLHSTVPESLSKALSEVIEADGTIGKWKKERLEDSAVIEDKVKKAREVKEMKNINMKIKPFEIPDKPQKRLEEFGIEIKPETPSEMIKELKEAEELQEKLEKDQLRPEKKKKTKQDRLEIRKKGSNRKR